MNKTHSEKRLSGKTVFKGKVISVTHDRIALENGKETLREVVRHPGAVGVFAMEGDKVVLVRQFRYPIGKELLEIPAGKLEPGEEPLPAAIRELSEETGGFCTHMTMLGVYYGSAGILDEKLTLYFARLTGRGGAHPDDDEFLTVEKYTLSQLEELIARGEITDGKTLSAYTLAKAQGLI